MILPIIAILGFGSACIVAALYIPKRRPQIAAEATGAKAAAWFTPEWFTTKRWWIRACIFGLVGCFFGPIGAAIGFTVWVVLMFPTYVAIRRRHPKVASIAVLNALLGVTVIGWVAALVWAVANEPPQAS